MPVRRRYPFAGRLFSTGILLWWAVMTAVLVWRELLSPYGIAPLLDVSPDELDELKDRTQWQGIYVKNRKIGYASTQLSAEGDGWIVRERVTLRMSLMGYPREIKSSMDLATTFDFALSSFRMQLDSGPVAFEMSGQWEDGGLSIETRSGGKTRRRRIPLKRAPWVPQNLRYMLLRTPLKIGRKFRFPLLDPLTLSCKPIELRVVDKDSWTVDGKTIPVYRLTADWNGLQSRLWVSEAGETLREDGWSGFSLIRETPEQALFKGWPKGEGLDLIQALAIPVENALPSPRELSYLKVRFSGFRLASYAFHESRQITRGQIVEVFRGDLSNATLYRLPHPQTAGFERALRSTALVQSDDPQIRQLTRQILKGRPDARRAVALILGWIHENLEKVPTISVPNAVEVLEARRGDCNEHAVLFAAMCRAARIPAKIVAGVLYDRGHFYYHAWNEVYLGSWFAADPLLGQFPADAAHVKLVEGNLQSQSRLAGLIGSAKAEILAFKE